MLLASSLVHADTAKVDADLLEILDTWEPKSVEIKDKIITIALNEKRVTKTIYEAVIKLGVCMTMYLGNKTFLDDVSKIIVLNEYSYQGWEFDQPKEACTKMGEASGKKSDALLYYYTRIN